MSAGTPTGNHWLVSAVPQTKEQKWPRLKQETGVGQAADRGTGVSTATDLVPGTVVGHATDLGPEMGEIRAANQRTGKGGLALWRWAAAKMSTWAVGKQAVASPQTAGQHRGTILVGARLCHESWLVG